MCKVIEEMLNDVSVRTYIEACVDNGISNQDEIISKLLEKFKFLTREQANKYFA